jgi:hypothetical protein
VGLGFLLLGLAALAPSVAHVAGRRVRLSRALVDGRNTISRYGIAVLLISAAAYLVVSSGP